MASSVSRIAGILALLVVLAWPAPAVSLWGIYSNQQRLDQQHWSRPLVDLLNATKRVGGLGRGNESLFFFRGDTAAFNRFLEGCERIGEGPVHVRIHPRSNDGKRSMAWHLDHKNDPDSGFDWRLYLMPRNRAAGRARPPPVPPPGGIHAQIDVWVDRDIDVSRMRLLGDIAAVILPEGTFPR